MSKVLLVEDDQLIIRLYTKTLEMAGFEVQSAENGLAALELLPHFHPDIVLLDIMMPTMNGVEFLQKIQAVTETGELPVIVLTNVADSDVKMSAAAAGASVVLVKSETEPDEVVSAVNGVLNKEILQTESLEGDEETGGLPPSTPQA